MGDKITTATAPSNGTAAPPMGTNEDLLSQTIGGAPINSHLELAGVFSPEEIHLRAVPNVL